ncbi:hypothetical protein LEP1GSC068_3664 [Leptospira sp. Fiocruz LV3954]|nr:hypothetical protein LEP1GSC068_3664 [Leptospira sp. Fiocruz LV3954]EMI66181.1 hypothetical protein LEP1GSC076_2758 [Leptospira sp. Fiocruz LV4135]
MLENYRFFLRIFGDSILMNPGFLLESGRSDFFMELELFSI